MSETLLSVKNLSVDFIADGHITQAVKNISFDVAPGELVALVGESGSGKSVTSLSLMSLLPKQARVKGQVTLYKENEGVDLFGLSQIELNAIRGKDIAMIFQEPMTSLNPVFTCGYQVMEAIRLHEKVSASLAKEKAITLFEKVRLPNPANMIDRYPHQLSGGQKQRVMIAMAMSCNPALLIADEPTTALDVTVQQTILTLIKELQSELGLGVIFITHDLGLVADISDKVLIMFKGEIVEQGITSAVLQQPQHPYTKALLACRPDNHPRGHRLPVVDDFFKVSNINHLTKTPNPVKKITLQKTTLTENLSNDNALVVENLQVFYPGKNRLFGKNDEPFKAVDDVSFCVKKGEIVGLVGESGCGKTTLGRAILQLVKPTAGNIILDGTNIARLSTADLQTVRKNLQIVFQDPYGSLNPRMTIGNAILEPMLVHHMPGTNKVRKQQVIDLLEKVNLSPDHFSRYPHQFSGGQRQRICIARALALNPSFLIFDESVSALDISVQAQVLNLINDLKNEFGFTAIFISHDLSVVHYISDRIMVMQHGKIIEQGTADEIYYSPMEAYTRQLIAAIPGKKMS